MSTTTVNKTTMPSPEMAKEFQSLFGVSIMKFNDPALMIARGRYSFDVFKFDEWLSNNNDDYDHIKAIMLVDGSWKPAALADYANQKGFYKFLTTLMSFY